MRIMPRLFQDRGSQYALRQTQPERRWDSGIYSYLQGAGLHELRFLPGNPGKAVESRHHSFYRPAVQGDISRGARVLQH